MNYAIYQEIPVPAGDYVVGNGNSSVNMTTILYLDIGANADESSGGTSGEIENTNIDFVYEDSASANGLAKIDATGYVSSGVVFSISCTPTDAAKLLYFKRDSSGNAQGTDVGVIYYTASGYTITPAGNGASTNKDPSSKEEGEA